MCVPAGSSNTCHPHVPYLQPTVRARGRHGRRVRKHAVAVHKIKRTTSPRRRVPVVCSVVIVRWRASMAKHDRNRATLPRVQVSMEMGCDNCAVNCVYTYYPTPCSTICTGQNGTYNYQCNVTAVATNGGTCPSYCPSTVGVSNGATYNCTAQTWTPWTTGQPCTATCGYGWQYMYTQCYDLVVDTYQLIVQPCNTNSCTCEYMTNYFHIAVWAFYNWQFCG